MRVGKRGFIFDSLITSYLEIAANNQTGLLPFIIIAPEAIDRPNKPNRVRSLPNAPIILPWGPFEPA